jgi:hypothetical protein
MVTKTKKKIDFEARDNFIREHTRSGVWEYLSGEQGMLY